jgi:hypothetical protein
MLLVCWGFFIDETGATHFPRIGGSSSLLSRHAYRVDVVDVWVRLQLTVNWALHGSNGKEVEASNTMHIVPYVGSEWLVQFSFMV